MNRPILKLVQLQSACKLVLIKMNILLLSPYPQGLLPALAELKDSWIVRTKPLSRDFCLEKGIDFLVSYGYRHILTKEVLELFPRKAINLHMSILPISRGAHPNFWSIAEGMPSGVTIHLLDEGLDTGNILIQHEVQIDQTVDTFSSSYIALSRAVEGLFRLNWRYLRTAESSGWRQQGVATVHRSIEIRQWLDCLPESWDTPISRFQRLAAMRSGSPRADLQ